MVKKNTRNNQLLRTAKDNSNPKIYSMLLKLVNDEREDLAEEVLKIDYLLEYASTCIKQKDYDEAEDTLSKVANRMKKLKDEDVDTSYLDYLFDGISGKCKL